MKEPPEGVKVWVEHEREYLEGPDGGLVLSTRGGLTRVRLLMGEEELAVGEAICSPRDNYNKKLGRMIALGRALKALEASM